MLHIHPGIQIYLNINKIIFAYAEDSRILGPGIVFC